MKIMVPTLAPSEMAEKSPYPIVVMDTRLYQRLSKTPTSRSERRSKKKEGKGVAEDRDDRQDQKQRQPNPSIPSGSPE